MLAALLAAAVLPIVETATKPVADGWAEPAVWSRVESVPLGAGVFRLVWDREALYVYVEALDGPFELRINTSNVRSERLTHLDRRYVINNGSLSGTAIAGVELGTAGERVEVTLPWSALGGTNGEIALDLRIGKITWNGTARLVTAKGTGVPVWTPAPQAARRGTLFFQDDFGLASRAELMRNILRGPSGYRPAKWAQIDDRAWDDPGRGFWNIPERGDVLVQAGKSDHSVLFIGRPLPEDAANYDIEFLQCRADHKRIAFILGAARPDLQHDGIEFSYESRVPASDTKTANLYYSGALGEGVIVDQAFTNHWVPHRIEVRGKRVRWLQADRVMAEGEAPGLRPGGFFGIAHYGERGTQYDDFTIRVIGRGQ